MSFSKSRVLLLGFCILVAPIAQAQYANHFLDAQARVLNLLFPLDAGPEPYYVRLVLRFGDTHTQLVVVVHPGGKAEMIRYTLADTSGVQFSRLITMVEENPNL